MTAPSTEAVEMIGKSRIAPEAIRRAREEAPQMRERDLAAKLGISECEFVAAFAGEGSVRISADINALLPELGALGEVMALTRNESAVHEKIGKYENVHTGKHAAMVLSDDIDLRIFPANWVHGFAVEKSGETETRRSLQFFDAAGDAVHKIHLRPESDTRAYLALIERFRSGDQGPHVGPLRPRRAEADAYGQFNAGDDARRGELRSRWEGMTDVHQFFGILRELKLKRHEALEIVGNDLAWRVEPDVIPQLLQDAANQAMPIMCFVGNHGCIQIHSGPIANIKPMGPWINIMDPGFHLHLRLDHIASVWTVRKPTSDGPVTSVEVYGADNQMIIQFFGKRGEGHSERGDWRSLAEGLPRIPNTAAA